MKGAVQGVATTVAKTPVKKLPAIPVRVASRQRRDRVGADLEAPLGAVLAAQRQDAIEGGRVRAGRLRGLLQNQLQPLSAPDGFGFGGGIDQRGLGREEHGGWIMQSGERGS